MFEHHLENGQKVISGPWRKFFLTDTLGKKPLNVLGRNLTHKHIPEGRLQIKSNKVTVGAESEWFNSPFHIVFKPPFGKISEQNGLRVLEGSLVKLSSDFRKTTLGILLVCSNRFPFLATSDPENDRITGPWVFTEADRFVAAACPTPPDNTPLCHN